MHQSVNKRNMPTHHKLTGHARKKKNTNAENKTTQYMYIPFTGCEIQFCNQVKKTNYMSISACLGKVVTYAYSWISDKSCTD